MTVGRDTAEWPSPAPEADSLRILLVSDYYPPFIGGVQRQIRLLGQELAARGHDVQIATVWSPGTPQVQREGAVSVYRIPQVRSSVPRLARGGKHHPPPFPDPVTVPRLRRLVRRFVPDVVHSYGWLSYAAAAALDDVRIPLILSARDYAYGCATRTLVHEGGICSGPEVAKCLACASRYYGHAKGAVATAGVRAFRSGLAGRVDVLHSISTYVRDIVRRDFLDDRVAGIPHVIIPSFAESEPVDAASADPAETARLDAELPDEPFILFVGALRREKGIEPLLEAYRRLEGAPPLVLAGTREVDTPAEIPPGVVVVEDLPHDSVMLAWRRALFGVAPSLWPEPLGSVVYEGMSEGRAVIGTVPGGHADMIEDGVSGILVPAGDVDALAGAMRRLTDDPAERERLARAAASRARLFTAGHVVPRWERTYRDAIAAARPSLREAGSATR